MIEEVDCVKALAAQGQQHLATAAQQSGATPQQSPKSSTAEQGPPAQEVSFSLCVNKNANATVENACESRCEREHDHDYKRVNTVNAALSSWNPTLRLSDAAKRVYHVQHISSVLEWYT